MNKNIRAIVICLFMAAATAAATSRPSLHLTVQHVLALTAPASAPAVNSYRIEISGLGQTVLPATGPEGQIASVQEAIFPTDYTPPLPPQPGDRLAILPSTPTNFERINTGWTVRLNAKPLGKLIAVSGIADCVEANLVPAGYGAVAGPIYAGQTETVVSPNVLNMAKAQTTTTRFQIFAVPGESYEVTFYRGAKVEKHRVSVLTE